MTDEIQLGGTNEDMAKQLAEMSVQCHRLDAERQTLWEVVKLLASGKDLSNLKEHGMGDTEDDKADTEPSSEPFENRPPC